MARQTNRKQSGVRMSEITPPRIVAEPQPLHLSLEVPRTSPDSWSMPAAGAESAARRPVVLDLAGDDDSAEDRHAAIEQKLFSGRSYVARLRVYHPGVSGTTSLQYS